MDLSELYLQLKKEIDDLVIDLHKNKGGNSQAGVRLRRKLSDAKKIMQAISKESLAADKARKQAKKEAK